MTEEILVSIITVTYNAKRYLECTINSVLNQTYSNIEYIIIDGSSTDGTVDIIKKYSDKLAYWVSEPDNGLYCAMNKGIRQAHGTLIGIVNADDYYERDTVQNVVSAFHNQPDVGVFHGNIRIYANDGHMVLCKGEKETSRLRTSFPMYHPTFFVNRTIYGTIGLYEERYRISSDYDFALRCYLAGVKFGYIDKILSNMRSGGISSVQTDLAREESRNSRIRNGLSEDEIERGFFCSLSSNAFLDIRYNTIGEAAWKNKYHTLKGISMKRVCTNLNTGQYIFIWIALYVNFSLSLRLMKAKVFLMGKMPLSKKL